MPKARDLTKLEEALGYHFEKRQLLEQALTHKSYAQLLGTDDNERLEFLGDAVLQLVVSRHLYRTHPELSEGDLAKIRSLLVSRPTLAQEARDLNVGLYIRVGRGEELSGARDRDSLLEDTLEAIFGAIYLDSGFRAAEKVILTHLPYWSRRQLPIVDAKSTLQEHLQQKEQATPTYNLTEEHGPDHNKSFVVQVCFQDEVLGRGVGRSKKAAAQAAAREALTNLDVGYDEELPES